MTGGQWAAVAVSVTVAILVTGMLFALVSLTRTVTRLRQAVDQFTKESVPLVVDLRTTSQRADAEFERANAVLVPAESVNGSAPAGSRLTYLNFSNSVVKALAFGSGVARAGQRLRHVSANGNGPRALPAAGRGPARRSRRAR